MKIKTFESAGKQYAELLEGKPVYIYDDGRETGFDAPGTVATISRINGEAKANRERYEKAELSLNAYSGIKDPAAALKAMELASNLEGKKLIDAGEVDRLKAEIAKSFEGNIAETAKAYEARLAEANKKFSDLDGQYSSEKISNALLGSKFAADSLAIPADITHAMFGRNFSIQDNKVVAKDASGNLIYSTARPGELANADEALAIIVGSYANKDAILKGGNQSGGGSRGPNGGTAGTKTITRATFDALDPHMQATRMKEGFTVSQA